MAAENIAGIEIVFYISTAVVVLSNVFHTIFSHELLRQCYLLVLYICLCFFAICCLTTLSSVCVIRRKNKAANKPVWRLRDSDLESEDDETEDLEKESNWLKRKRKQFDLFIEHRRIYGLVFKVGVFFIVTALCMEGASFYYPSKETDFHASFKILVTTGLFLVLLVLKMADFPKPKPIKRTYKPFDESISVPMRVFAPKVVLHLTRNLLYVVGILFYQSSALYGVLTVRNMSQQEIKRFQDATEFEHIHKVMFIIMIICNGCGVILLIENVLTAIGLAKEDLLLTFEKNWMRNLVALDYFLPEIPGTSLEELRDAFLEKSQREDLTAVEQKVLQYIETPLWKSKRNFLPKRQEGNGIPKELLSDWPLEPPRETPVVETTPPPSEFTDEEVLLSSPSPIPSPPVTRSRAKLK